MERMSENFKYVWLGFTCNRQQARRLSYFGRRSPAVADIEGGDTAKNAYLSESRRSDNEDSIVGDQLACAAVKKKDKHNFAAGLVGRMSAVPNAKFATYDAVVQGTGIRGRHHRRLHRNDRILSKNGALLCVRCVEKFFHPLTADRDFGVVRACRHNPVILISFRGGFEEAEKESADSEKGRNIHFLCKIRLYA